MTDRQTHKNTIVRTYQFIERIGPEGRSFENNLPRITLFVFPNRNAEQTYQLQVSNTGHIELLWQSCQQALATLPASCVSLIKSVKQQMLIAGSVQWPAEAQRAEIIVRCRAKLTLMNILW